MAVNPSPFGPKPQFELSDGTPAVGNKLFFYVAGSVNTKRNTFTDSTGGSANANPIVLNSLGQPTTQIWFTAGLSYKVVYAPSTDTDPPTSPIWTVDNLLGINDVTVGQDQWVAFSGVPTFVGATSFTLTGDQTSTFHVGRRVKTTNSGGTVYSTITASTFGALTTVVVANDSGTLDAGLSAVSYGLLSKIGDSMPRGIFSLPQRGALAGLGLSTAGGSATMTTAAGQATDTTSAAQMTLASSVGKTTSSWAVGSGNGGLDTGAIANSTWYHFYLITRLDTGVVDVLFSTNASAPTMPANYTLKRRIGSGKTDGAAQWTAFSQNGDEFTWSTPPAADQNAVGTTANRTLVTVAVPTGVKMKWTGNMQILGGAGGAQMALLTDPANADIAPSATVTPLSNLQWSGAATTNIATQQSCWTNTSAQIGVRVQQATDAIRIVTIGWLDRRGRDD